MAERLWKKESQWKRELSNDVYRITRESGVEPAFTGKYWNFNQPGIYGCVCCGTELFDSEAKFDPGSGWPSFYTPVSGQRVDAKQVSVLGMVVDEVKCSKCDAHLGLLFKDGPQPTGLRYSIYSAALKFKPQAI